MDLIDRDKLLEQLETLLKKREEDAYYSGDRCTTVTWNDAIFTIKIAPSVKTDTVNAVVYIPYEALMETSLCEEYVKSRIAMDVANELLKKIDIRSCDPSPYDSCHGMMKEFRAMVTIVTGTKKDGDAE